MAHFHDGAGLGSGGSAGDFVVGIHLSGAVSKGHAVFGFRIIGVGHPRTGGAILRQHGAAPADFGKFFVGIGKLVYISCRICDALQPFVAAIGKGGDSNSAAAVIDLNDFVDSISIGIGLAIAVNGVIAVDVVNLRFIAVGIADARQMSVDKEHFVVFVIADPIAAGLILVDL